MPLWRRTGAGDVAYMHMGDFLPVTQMGDFVPMSRGVRGMGAAPPSGALERLRQQVADKKAKLAAMKNKVKPGDYSPAAAGASQDGDTILGVPRKVVGVVALGAAALIGGRWALKKIRG